MYNLRTPFQSLLRIGQTAMWPQASYKNYTLKQLGIEYGPLKNICITQIVWYLFIAKPHSVIFHCWWEILYLSIMVKDAVIISTTRDTGYVYGSYYNNEYYGK